MMQNFGLKRVKIKIEEEMTAWLSARTILDISILDILEILDILYLMSPNQSK